MTNPKDTPMSRRHRSTNTVRVQNRIKLAFPRRIGPPTMEEIRRAGQAAAEVRFLTLDKVGDES